MIPANVIEDIRYRCDIESVISSYVSLKRAGSNLKGLCPFHSEKTPSFTVYPETQSFYCFGCGAGGDVISFVMRTENLDYVSAVETLAKRAGITLPEFGDKPRDDGVTRTRVLQMNLEAAKFYRKMLYDDNVGAAGRRYFVDRGLSMMAIKRFGLGYSPPSGNQMLRHLTSLGFKPHEIQTAYFAGKSERGYYDYFRGRVMFPIIDVSGNVIAFGGRVLDDTKPKYLNTSDTPAFKKSRNLFALNYAKNTDAGYMILCEGYMDVIAVHMAGFPNSVATLGTALTSDQARIMAKYTKKVILSYDSDEAGVNASKRAIPILTEAGLEVKMLRIEGAKDPDEFIKKYGASRFKILIEGSQGKMEYLCDQVLKKYNILVPEEKLKAAHELCEIAAGVYSQVEREIYIARFAERLSLDPKNMKLDVERLIRRKQKDETAETKRKIVSDTLGYGDRINRDFVKNAKAARAEEAILGILLLHPEFLGELREGELSLSADDFFTDFGRRVFTAMTEGEGMTNISLLAEQFSPDEISRITKMQVDRTQLTRNGREVLLDNIRTLKREKEEKPNSDELEDIKTLLSKKKK